MKTTYDPKAHPGKRVKIVPGMRVMDTETDNASGVCIATDHKQVVFRVDEGPMEPGSLNMVDWELVAICPEVLTAEDASNPATAAARRC